MTLPLLRVDSDYTIDTSYGSGMLIIKVPDYADVIATDSRGMMESITNCYGGEVIVPLYGNASYELGSGTETCYIFQTPDTNYRVEVEQKILNPEESTTVLPGEADSIWLVISYADNYTDYQEGYAAIYAWITYYESGNERMVEVNTSYHPLSLPMQKADKITVEVGTYITSVTVFKLFKTT